MRTVTPFDLSVLSTHRSFFVLTHIDANATNLDVVIDTPSGRTSADFIDLYRMQNDMLVAAWKDPFKHTPHHNAIVTSSNGYEVVNLTQTERLLEFYNKPLNSRTGTFAFANSVVVVQPNTNWRCDAGLYGTWNFRQVPDFVENNNEIIFFENVLSLNGDSHLCYLEGKHKTAARDYEINHSFLPCAAATLQEILKLVDEWSIVADEPFNNQDIVSAKAKRFMTAMRWTDDELALIRSATPMQISRYLTSEPNARQRPSDVTALDTALTAAVFKRMAHGSLAYANALHGGNLWDQNALLEVENAQLDAGIRRFKAAFDIPESVSICDSDAIAQYRIYREAAGIVESGPFIHSQARNFCNKATLLERAASGDLF